MPPFSPSISVARSRPDQVSAPLIVVGLQVGHVEFGSVTFVLGTPYL